jgi:hypothetical protein
VRFPREIKGAEIRFREIGNYAYMSWKDLENAVPELATFGLKRVEMLAIVPKS